MSADTNRPDPADDDPFAADPPAADTPWDMRPATAQQVDYLTKLAKRLHEEADWKEMDTTFASDAIDNLNRVRKAAGLGFKPMEGMDTTSRRPPRPRSGA